MILRIFIQLKQNFKKDEILIQKQQLSVSDNFLKTTKLMLTHKSKSLSRQFSNVEWSFMKQKREKLLLMIFLFPGSEFNLRNSSKYIQVISLQQNFV